MITLDWTLLASGVVFLFTLWALNRLLFQPLFQVLDARRARTSEAQREVSRKLEYYEKLVDEYQHKIREEKQSGYQLAEAKRRSALQQRQEKLSQARDEAEAVLTEARKEIEQEVETAQKKLRQQSEEIAGMITSKLLGST